MTDEEPVHLKLNNDTTYCGVYIDDNTKTADVYCKVTCNFCIEEVLILQKEDYNE